MDLFETITPGSMPLSMVKQYLVVDHNDEDLLIQMYMQTARKNLATLLKTDMEITDQNEELNIVYLKILMDMYENKSLHFSKKLYTDPFVLSILSCHTEEIL
jgi:uncharacterized phage protein (predicted DNA packaging)